MTVKIYLAETYYTCISALAGEIAKRGSSLDISNIVFTEEKNTLLTEREIVFKTGGTFNTRVFSMRKFLKSVSAPTGLLSKQGSVMLCRRIISENAARLGCFRRLRARTLAPTVYELIAQLKSAKVSPSELAAAAETAGGLLSDKLKDLSLLYAEYEKAVEARGFKDQSNYLADLPTVIANGALDGADVFVSAYSSFTRQEADALRAALGRAKSVTAFFVAGDNEYLYTNEAYGIFKRIAEGYDVEVVRLPEAGVGAPVLETVFNPEKFNAGARIPAAVYAYEAQDTEDEISRMAAIIKSEVIDGKIRYRDAEAVVRPEAAPVVKRIFAEYGIPCFIDEKKSLIEHPAAKMLLQYVNAYRRGFARKEYFAFVKNPVVCGDKSFTDGYENFCLRCGADRGGFIRPFKYGADDANFAEYEAFRESVARLFAPMKKKAAASYYVSVLNGVLSSLSSEEKCEELADKFKSASETAEAAYGKQAYAKITAALAETENILGDTELEAEDFCGVLASGFEADEISVLPQYNDAVFVGGFREARLVKAKYLFLTGLTSDVPEVKSDVAMLTDGDLDKLENLRVIVEPKIRTVNRRERENAGLAAAAFSERLYMSYALTGDNGKPQVKSELFSYIGAIYAVRFLPPDVAPEKRYLTPEQAEKRFACDVNCYLDGATDDLSAAAGCYAAFGKASRTRADEILLASGRQIAMRLKTNGDVVLKNKKLSASLLENYFTCPYKNFLDNGLSLTERRTGEAAPLDVGNFLHAVFEAYAPLVPSLEREEDGDVRVLKIADEVLAREEFAVFTEKGAGRNLIARLKEEAVAFCRRIFRQFKNSGFVLLGQEVEFGFGDKKYKPVKLNCKDGARYIEGKVDRVDVMGDYVRIVDYKTGMTESLDKNLFVGKKLQLYLYMNAFVGDKRPAGVYYCAVSDAFTREGEKAADFSGHTLGLQDVLYGTDTSLAFCGKSDIAAITLKTDKKTGELVYGGTHNLTPEEMDKYLKYALLISARGAEQIASGVIAASPFGEACSYCKYGGMCDFAADAAAEKRSVAAVKKETITGGVDAEAGLWN